MTEKRKALGRGIEALLPGSRPSTITSTAPPPRTVPIGDAATRELSLELIERNPFQTRAQVADAELAELAESIRTAGVLQPVLVRPLPNGRFQLMAGERRYLASQKAGKQTIPAVIRHASDQQALEITIIENLQREDLGALEQARAFERLSREFNLTQEQIAARTGKERATVANFLRLLKLPAEIQSKLQDNTLTMGHAKALLALGDAEAMAKTAEKIERGHWSVRQTEEYIKSLLAPAPKVAIQAKAIDPNVKQAALDIQSTLGCKVEIADRNGKGRITIEYKSLEDFDRVVEALSAKAP